MKFKVSSDAYRWKMTVIFIFSLYISYSSYAQKILRSTPDKVASRFSDYDIIGKNNMGLVVHYFGSNESEIVIYDANLKISNRREMPFKSKGVSLEGIVLLPDNILLFYTTNSETYQYFKLKVLDNRLNIPNETILLDSLPMASVGNGKVFYVKTSPDKSKILTFSILKSKVSYYVRFTIMSDSIRVLNRNLFSMTEGNNIALKSIKINNEGNVIALLGSGNGNADGDYNFDKYTSISFNRSTNTIAEQVLQDPDYIFKNVISEVSTRRNFAYIAACYKNTKNKNDVGIYYQIIDLRTNTVLLNSKMPFSDEILQRSQTGEFKTWQDKAELVRPKRIIPRSDGGFVLVTEGEYKFTRVERLPVNTYGYYNATPYTSSVKYVDQNYYYDIGVFSINNDGTLDWQTNMPKSQVSENDDGYFSSFAFFEVDNVLKFLYNEDFYNIGNFVEYNVNPNGLTKRQSVLNTEKQNVVLVPLKAKQLDAHTIVFPSEQKRTLQFVMFQY
ncbi:MAG: hypothetical protein JWN78_1468 [Bacteroidota bacterium]|nr:hypothetical protein [Bacteroidota bacterium]